ncbi:MAG TPA: sigma 54-interacting transcriptional regulator [Kofleriaceae bacterium]|nr:sigma 54-interacting transcriptional regulator [Kofleriaceae bacterium]
MAADDVSTVRTSDEAGGTRRRALLAIVGDDVRVHTLPSRGDVTIGRGSKCDVTIDHATLSREHLTLRLGDAIEVIDRGSANGTRLRGNKLPADVAVAIAPYETVQAGDVALVVQEEVGASVSRAEARPSGPIDQTAAPVLLDPAMKRLYEVAARVARGTIGVLITGETGAGKEVLAEHVHKSSPRAAAPLLRVNCAALNESLVESELFGHEKGAFTGAAKDRAGLIEAAEHGTVMLDEIGELPPAIQAKLLRVIEDHRVTRVGATDARAIDVRFIAATNRDLAADVEAGRFRRDLYFRIAGAVLAIPPLRARPSEIEPLARAFLDGRAITPAALAALRAHAWPGNVRELKSTIDRALLVADEGGAIDVDDLALAPADPTSNVLEQELETIERARIADALARCGGNQTRAAELLGMPRRTLVKRISKYGLR